MESTSSAIIPEKRLDFNNVSMYLFILPLSGDTPCDKRSVPGEYNIPNVENSTYTNALTEYNDVKSRKKIGENIYDKKSYTDRRGQV